MSQQINLLNQALVRQKEFIDAPMMMMMPGVLALILLGTYAFEQYQLQPLVKESERTTQEVQAMQAQLDQVTNEYMQRNTTKVLEGQILATEKKLKSYETIFQALGITPNGAGQGFSTYMEAFARQHLEGLWLTSFEINDADKIMVIRGRALRPELVPQYIIKLGLDPAFRGRTFATLDMTAQKIDVSPKPEAAATQATAVPATVEPLPPYVEFTLQSTSDQDKAALAASRAKS